MYVRLSVTDQCDFHCRYCRPIEPAARAVNEAPAAPVAADVADSRRHEPALSIDQMVALLREIERVCPLHRIRLTGGEPLLRPDLETLVEALAVSFPGAERCLTTNGYRLAPRARALREAGLDRVNVSLDAVAPDRFAEVTGVDGLPRVLAGIEAARDAGFESIRLNTVLLRSASGRELSRLVTFAASQGAEIRFIELMPIGPAASMHHTEYLSARRALSILKDELDFQGSLGPQGTARRHSFIVDGIPLVVGFITSVSEPFCETCDRIRLDCHGRLRPCLRRTTSVDLAGPLLAGDRETLNGRIRDALAAKDQPGSLWPTAEMSAIGG